jgi:diamine N-acetyltransferase
VDITIRLSTPADLEALARLNRMAQDLHVEHEPRYFKAIDHDEIRHWFQAFLGNPGARIWIAELDGVALAYAAAQVRARDPNPFSPGIRWCHVAVVREHRGKGIARRLLEEVSNAAASDGATELQLSTWVFNADAQEAFARLGFRPTQMRMVRPITASPP